MMQFRRKIDALTSFYIQFDYVIRAASDTWKFYLLKFVD